jgi:PTS system nitrogen regulatory IIA component
MPPARSGFRRSRLLFENLHGLSRALITDSLFARERLGSTGLGHGVAIPHGRIKGLKAPMAALFQLASRSASTPRTSSRSTC